MRRIMMIATACLVVAATPLFAQEAKTGKDKAGKAFLQTPADMTLYVFDGDGDPGTGSKCDDQCAKAWPPFAAAADAADHDRWTVVTRKDGSRQWAYKGRPLYGFAKDTAPGQENGNSFNGNKWHVAAP